MNTEKIILNSAFWLTALLVLLLPNTILGQAAGSLDPTFTATDGRVITQFGNFSESGRKVLIQPDGKIIIAAVGTAVNSFGDFSVSRFNANGSLDPTFGAGGKVTTVVGIQSSTLFDAALQSDGKIVLVGAARSSNATGDDFAAVRYNADGSLDTGFGSGGKVITPFGENSSEYATAVAVQLDGKIVLAGNTAGGFGLVRYNSDGSLDTTFGTGGKLTTFLSQNGAFARTVIVRGGGKIIVAGSVTVPIPQNSVNQIALVQYNPDGSLDTTFDGDGKVQTSFAYFATCGSALIQPDGKIVVAGYAKINVSDSLDFAAVRFNPDGSLDEGFGFGGKVLTAVTNNDDRANSAALQSDGKIVLAGSSEFSLVRYKPDGSLDSSFGLNGMAITSVAGEDSANSIAVQSDGKLVVVGSAAGLAASSKIALVRFQPNGALDGNFGLKVPGRTTTVVSGVIDESRAVLTQPDGKIVSAGRCRVAEPRHYFCLVRYNADGTLDSGFGTRGLQATKIGTGDTDSEIRSVALQSDGKIVVAGRIYDANTNLGRNDFAVARYLPNGTLDANFGNGGIKILAAPNQHNEAYAVAVQTDGKIIVAGGFDVEPDPSLIRYEMAVVRLNSDGSFDFEFGNNGSVVLTGNGGIAYAVALRTDGKIIVAGSIYNPSSTLNFGLVRLNANGSSDSTFGTGGTVLTSFGNAESEARSVRIQPDGKIAVGGFARIGSTNDFAVARYSSDGSLDAAFGNNGKTTTAVAANSADTASALVLQSNGKIILVGTSVVSTNSNLALVRYNSNGLPDSLFGTGGIVITDYAAFGNTAETAAAAALQPDGQLIVTGSLRSADILGLSNTRRDFLAVRYNVRTGAAFDFDGDGKADVSVFRPESGAWYLQQSQAGFTGLPFGLSTDKLVPADYDGDGKTDLAVFRSGVWYLHRSQAGFTGIQFGDGNDVPVPGDYDGDGKAELAVFRPSNGYWYILNLSSNQFTATLFGIASDKPIPADYDGDGKTDIAVNRGGNWYIQRSQFGFTGISFGVESDKLVPADYDGDGKTDIAVFRPSNGSWYLQQSTAGFTGIAFGLGTDIPVAADYDGDGKADLAVVRNGVWYLNRSSQGFTGVQFGTSTDLAIPNAFVR